MGIIEYLAFERPEGLAVGVAIIIFTLTYYALSWNKKLRSMAIVVAFVISFSSAWRLYRERFYGWETTLALILIVLVFVIVIILIWRFIKRMKKGIFG